MTQKGPAAAMVAAGRADGALSGKLHGLALVLLLAVPLILAAVLRMALFQDGASYVVELMTDHAAVRHYRYSVLLVQAPAILASKLAFHLGFDGLDRVRITGFVFNLSYTLMPLVAVGWSWILVRGRDRSLMIWPSLLLLLNQINFSWVSEILMAMQLSCPLMLAACQPRPNRLAAATIVLLVPVIMMLHALVPLLLVALTGGMLLRLRGDPDTRRRSAWLAILFLSAAAARLMFDAVWLTDYEREMLAPPQIADYFAFSVENAVFMAVIVLIMLASALPAVRRMRGVAPLFVVLAAAALTAGALDLFAAAQRGAAPVVTWAAPVVTLVVGAAMLLRGWRLGELCSPARAGLIAVWCSAGAALSSLLVLDLFPLKSGTTVAIGAVMLILVGNDSVARRDERDEGWRARLMTHAIVLFALMAVGKAAIWHSATQRLEQVLRTDQADCIEREQLPWLRQPPFTILDNWALPSWTMITPEQGATPLVLERGDCGLLRREKILVIDPWSSAPVANLPFVRLKPPPSDGH